MLKNFQLSVDMVSFWISFFLWLVQQPMPWKQMILQFNLLLIFHQKGLCNQEIAVCRFDFSLRVTYTKFPYYQFLFFILLSCRIEAFKSSFNHHMRSNRLDDISIENVEEAVNSRVEVGFSREEIVSLLEVIVFSLSDKIIVFLFFILFYLWHILLSQRLLLGGAFEF